MPGLRIAPRPAAGSAPKARPASSLGGKSAPGKKFGCGSGSGGFKPGNTCGKGGRQGLADRIKAARLKAKAGELDHSELRQTVRELRQHRRGKAGAVDNATARSRHAALREHHREVTSAATKGAGAHAARVESAKGYGRGSRPAAPGGHGGRPDPSRANVAFSTPGDQQRFADVSRHLFGRDVGHAEVASIVGAPHDSTARITIHGKEIHVHSRNDAMKSDRRIFRDEDGKLAMDNENFFVESGHQGKGIGTEVFGRQVEHAAAARIARIVTSAAKGHGKNGYLTWAKFGYRGPIPPVVHLELADSDLPREIRRSRRVEELMATEQGRDWWAKNGDTWKGEFDPTPGSDSRKIWDTYVATRATRHAKS